MSSYSELANTIIQQKGAGSRFSGLNTALDIMDAYKQARLKYQMDSQLKQQEGMNTGAAHIIASAPVYGATPEETSGQLQQLRQFYQGGPTNIATGATPQASQPSTISVSDTPGNLGSMDNSTGNTNLQGITITAQKPAPSDNIDMMGRPIRRGIKAESQQNAMEKQYETTVDKIVGFRTGGLGVQNVKVDAAGHALNLLNQTYDPNTKTFNIPPMLQAELAANVNNTISGSGVTADSMRQELQQRSIYGDWNKTMQYLMNTPKNSLPQDNAKLLSETIIRQGIKSQQYRDRYMETQKSLYPSGLAQSRVDRINKMKFGNSFTDDLQASQFVKDLFPTLDVSSGQTTTNASANASAPASSVTTNKNDPLGIR